MTLIATRKSKAKTKTVTKPAAKAAKLFTNGGSQAVRLPKEFAFEGKEVTISKEGDRVILEPLRNRPKTLGDLLDEIWAAYPEPSTIERPQQPPMPPAKSW